MARIQIPDFDESEEPAQTCVFCRSPDAVTFFDNDHCPLAACAPCSKQLTPFVARGAAAGAKSPFRRPEEAWEGFLEMSELFWSALSGDEYVDDLGALQHIAQIVERAREWCQEAERVARQAGEEDHDE